MGLRHEIARLALRRAHVLIVECPGETLLRIRAEAGIVREGWTSSISAADADVLLVCGVATGEVEAAVDRLWDQMVAPRVRVVVVTATDVPEAIRTARHTLLDEGTQRADASSRAGGGQRPRCNDAAAAPTAKVEENGHLTAGGRSDDDAVPAHESMDHGSMDHGSMDHESMDHGSMDHESMDHGSMSMSHGHHMDMDMSGPAGIPLASGEDDRDGLEMDALHVALGPILPAWPANLVLHCTLHGDVVAAAEAELLPSPTEASRLGPDEQTVLLIDAAARTVQLAGWEPVAVGLRRVRDDLLLPSIERHHVTARLQRLRRRVERSRTLRWSLRGVRPPAALERVARADVHELLLAQLEHAVLLISRSAAAPQPAPLPAVAAADLASAVVGQDLATARLLVAGLTPWGSAGRGSPELAAETTDG